MHIRSDLRLKEDAVQWPSLVRPMRGKARQATIRARLYQVRVEDILVWVSRPDAEVDQTGLIGGAGADATRSKAELMLENALLRQPLIVVSRQVKRPPMSWRERGIMVLLASKLRHWKHSLFIVQHDTLLRWHRDLFRLVWRRQSRAKRRGGRRPLSGWVVQLMRRMAREDPLWGAERIRGEMLKQNMGVAKSSIQKYTQDLRRVGPSGQSWGTFLRNDASEIWACDFLQTYEALFRSMFVFVIIALDSRRVVHVNLTRHPTDAWVAQQLREATPFGEGSRFLIRDNDKKYGGQFQHVVNGADIEILKTPAEAPRANVFCERFLGSLRRECLDYMLILSERHLRHMVSEYVTYFNQARPHQGINQRIPYAPHVSDYLGGEMVGLPVLGGLHHDYQRKAA
jgi:putative transposase